MSWLHVLSSSEVTLVVECAAARALELEAVTHVVDVGAPAVLLRRGDNTRLFSFGVGNVLGGLDDFAVLIKGAAGDLVVVVSEVSIVGEVLLVLHPSLFLVFGLGHLVLEGVEVSILAIELRLKLIDFLLSFCSCFLSLFLHTSEAKR